LDDSSRQHHEEAPSKFHQVPRREGRHRVCHSVANEYVADVADAPRAWHVALEGEKNETHVEWRALSDETNTTCDFLHCSQRSDWLLTHIRVAFSSVLDQNTGYRVWRRPCFDSSIKGHDWIMP
jgi:hypothetical protein